MFDQFPPLSDETEAELWEATPEKHRDRIYADFSDYVGADLGGMAQDAHAVDTDEAMLDLGRKIVSDWLTHRDREVDLLRQAGKLNSQQAA
jgi:hypothetical protein